MSDGWQALPDGSNVVIRPGITYALVASISKSVSQAEIVAKIPAGVTLLDYAEQGQRPGLGPDPNADHRYVAAKFVSQTYAGTLPWKSPWPTTIYELVHAWAAAGQGAPILPGASSSSSPVWPWVVLVGMGAGGLGIWWLSRRRRGR